jgi:hypothetical protein
MMNKLTARTFRHFFEFSMKIFTAVLNRLSSLCCRDDGGLIDKSFFDLLDDVSGFFKTIFVKRLLSTSFDIQHE